VGWILAALALASCSEKQPATVTQQTSDAQESEAGVSLELARERAARLTNIVYHLRFDIPADQADPIPAWLELHFDLADISAPLFLDFRQAPDSIQSLQINGHAREPQLVNEHIPLPAADLRTGRNEIEIAFTAGDSSLNRNPDFLYTLFVPDRARTAFPVFDQPDLKARFELILTVPDTWRVLANAPLARAIELDSGRREYRFVPSDRMSSYLFSFVAGAFQAITREVNGRPMTMLHRETNTAKVERNVDEIFELHGQYPDAT